MSKPSNLFSLFYYILLALNILELVIYQGFIDSLLFSPGYIFIMIFLFCLLLWRINGGKQLLNKQINQYNPMVAVVGFVSASALFLIEAYTYPNFIYATWYINHAALIDILVLSFFTNIITAPTTQLKRYYPTYFFGGFLLSCFALYTYNMELFLKLSLNASGMDDDNFMEWLQVLILGGGFVLMTVIAWFNKRKPFIAIFAIIASLFFLILIGEEVSYGERFVSYEKELGQDNYQNEFNIHNQQGVNEIVLLLYPAAFLYALISWLIYRLAQSKKWISNTKKDLWEFFCFRGQEILFFIPTLLFNPYADRTISEQFPHSILSLYEAFGIIPDFISTLGFLAQWRETFEVLFYCGIVIHFFNLYFLQKKTRKR